MTDEAARKKTGSSRKPALASGAWRRAPSPRVLWLAGGAVVLIVAVVVALAAGIGSPPKPPPPAQPSAADRRASPALVNAADAIGFHPTTGLGVGRVESLPASAAPPPANPKLLPVGSAAPDFTLRTPTGRTVSLSDFRGKAVLLEFFSTWCPHCVAETPHLKKLFGSLPRTRYAWLLVNSDGETAPSVFAFHRYFGLSAPTLLDPSGHPGDFHHQGAAGPVTIKYEVRYIPTLYVIDPGGRIAWRSDGEQPNALLRQELNRAAGD